MRIFFLVNSRDRPSIMKFEETFPQILRGISDTRCTRVGTLVTAVCSFSARMRVFPGARLLASLFVLSTISCLAEGKTNVVIFFLLRAILLDKFRSLYMYKRFEAEWIWPNQFHFPTEKSALTNW